MSESYDAGGINVMAGSSYGFGGMSKDDSDILVEAFSPNATGKLMGRPEIVSMAEKYGVSVPQLSIRYDLQLGLVPLPKSTHRDHMVQNADVGFRISEEDMETLRHVPEIESLSDKEKNRE